MKELGKVGHQLGVPETLGPRLILILFLGEDVVLLSLGEGLELESPPSQTHNSVFIHQFLIEFGGLKADDGLFLLDFHAKIPHMFLHVVVDVLRRVAAEGGLEEHGDGGWAILAAFLFLHYL